MSLMKIHLLLFRPVNSLSFQQFPSFFLCQLNLLSLSISNISLVQTLMCIGLFEACTVAGCVYTTERSQNIGVQNWLYLRDNATAS